MNKLIDALSQPAGLDDEIARLVRKFGVDAVRDSVKRVAKKRAGRKAEADWPLLGPWLKQDADDWLHDRQPEKLRTSYSIAKAFAEKYPGHDKIATFERVVRKLRKRRRWFYMVTAWQRAEMEYPVEVALRALEEMEAMWPKERWGMRKDLTIGRLQRYREQFGEVPADMTVDAMETELLKPDAPKMTPLGSLLAGIIDGKNS